MTALVPSERQKQHEKWLAARTRMLSPRAEFVRPAPVIVRPFRGNARAVPVCVYQAPIGPHRPNAPRKIYVVPPGPFRGRAAARFVIAAVAHAHGIEASDITGHSRKAHIVRARQECCWRLRGLGLSLPEVGRALGGRDHTTALHGITAHQKRIDGGGSTQ